jgi:hypothetical protein
LQTAEGRHPAGARQVASPPVADPGPLVQVTAPRRRSAPSVALSGDRLRQAHKAAKRADTASGALFDRRLAEALMLGEGQPVERQAAMFLRTAVTLEIAAERKAWPERIAGLPDRRAKSPRTAAEAVFG